MKEHETQLQDDYDVQLVSTWLKALYETDDRPEVLRVHNDVCRASDRTGNAFVVGQYMRYLVRAGSYDVAVALFQAVSQAVQSDEIVRKIVARAYVELGRLREAEEAIADTRDDFLRRSVVAKIDEYKAKVGYRESTPTAVRETPAATPQVQSKGKPTVFIVHGHDVGTRTSLENVLHRIGADPLTFDTLPKEGSPTVIEVLEKHVPNVDAIVTLLTPDDEGRKRGTADLFTARGRENCLIEAGFAMISRRSRSLLVALGGVNIPSDFRGIHLLEAEVWNGEVAFRMNTLTLKLRFVNEGKDTQEFSPSSEGIGSESSYLLDEATGKRYKGSDRTDRYVSVPAGDSVEFWIKYALPEGERPRHLTAVLNHGILLEHLEVP